MPRKRISREVTHLRLHIVLVQDMLNFLRGTNNLNEYSEEQIRYLVTGRRQDPAESNLIIRIAA